MIREFFLGIGSLFSQKGGRGRAAPPARRLVLMIVVATLPFVRGPAREKQGGGCFYQRYFRLRRPHSHRLSSFFPIGSHRAERQPELRL